MYRWRCGETKFQILMRKLVLRLRIFNSFAFTGVAFICLHWYTQNILNLTHLQTNLFLYIYIFYISRTILRLTKSDCIFIRYVWFLDLAWVCSVTKHFLFDVTIRLKLLKVRDVLFSLCKVIADLEFSNYNHIYLLRINKTYSLLYNI